MLRTARGGFTLVELLATIFIIFVLMGLLIAGINLIAGGTKAAADEQVVTSLDTARGQFVSAFGFQPPLVYDGGALNVASETPKVVPAPFHSGGTTYDVPIAEAYAGTATQRALPDRVNVFSVGNRDDLTYLFREKPVPPSGSDEGPISDKRYSKFTLAYYLGGVLPGTIDGVDGPGMHRPRANGTFEGVPESAFGRAPEAFEPFFATGASAARIEPDYADPLEFREHGVSADDVEDEMDAYRAVAGRIAVVDRNGRAFRFYRWEPDSGYNGANGMVDSPTQDDNEPDLNIPEVLLLATRGEMDNDPTGGNTELKSARWAIVGAGPDGVFGTEPADVLRERLRSNQTNPGLLRKEAAGDNLVRYGS